MSHEYAKSIKPYYPLSALSAFRLNLGLESWLVKRRPILPSNLGLLGNWSLFSHSVLEGRERGACRDDKQAVSMPNAANWNLIPV